VGLLAAFALNQKRSPRQIRNQKPLLSDFQRFVQDQGVETAWPKLTSREQNRLAFIESAARTVLHGSLLSSPAPRSKVP
jgi:hypothetical protein